MPFHWFVIISPLDIRYAFPHGWGNGYVVIPSDHPYAHGSLLSTRIDELVDVHGGVTFGPRIVDYDLLEDEVFKPHLSTEMRGHTICGFDTSHFGDNSTDWTKFNVKIETLRFLKQMKEVYAKAQSNPDL